MADPTPEERAESIVRMHREYLRVLNFEGNPNGSLEGWIAGPLP